jgi:hypothetical protein
MLCRFGQYRDLSLFAAGSAQSFPLLWANVADVFSRGFPIFTAHAQLF